MMEVETFSEQDLIGKIEDYKKRESKRKCRQRIVKTLAGLIVLCLFIYLKIFNTRYYAYDDSICVSYSTAWKISYPSEYNGQKITLAGGNISASCPNVRYILIEDGIETLCFNSEYKSVREETLQHSDLHTVRIPKSVQYIDLGAFEGYRSLRNLIWEEAQQGAWIESRAFRGTGLRRLELPDGVEGMGIYAFDDCNNLKYVSLPDTMTSMGFGAFSNCGRLKKVVLSNNLDTLPMDAFYNCSALKEMENSQNLKCISFGALTLTKLAVDQLADAPYFVSKHPFHLYGETTRVEHPNESVYCCWSYDGRDYIPNDFYLEDADKKSTYFMDYEAEAQYLSEKTGI